MPKQASRPTRVTADVAAIAAAVAETENRTMTEQISHWVRLGRQVERATSTEGRRLRSVIAGEDQFSSLSREERVVAHASIDAAMAERIESLAFGAEARRSGRVTVSLDEDGALIEIGADGRTRTL